MFVLAAVVYCTSPPLDRDVLVTDSQCLLPLTAPTARQAASRRRTCRRCGRRRAGRCACACCPAPPPRRSACRRPATGCSAPASCRHSRRSPGPTPVSGNTPDSLTCFLSRLDFWHTASRLFSYSVSFGLQRNMEKPERSAGSSGFLPGVAYA